MVVSCISPISLHVIEVRSHFSFVVCRHRHHSLSSVRLSNEQIISIQQKAQCTTRFCSKSLVHSHPWFSIKNVIFFFTSNRVCFRFIFLVSLPHTSSPEHCVWIGAATAATVVVATSTAIAVATAIVITTTISTIH